MLLIFHKILRQFKKIKQISNFRFIERHVLPHFFTSFQVVQTTLLLLKCFFHLYYSLVSSPQTIQTEQQLQKHSFH